MKTIRPERNDAPLMTQRAEAANPGLPAAMVRFAALALALVTAAFVFVLLRS